VFSTISDESGELMNELAVGKTHAALALPSPSRVSAPAKFVVSMGIMGTPGASVKPVRFAEADVVMGFDMGFDARPADPVNALLRSA
jgi:hypothetical protein